MKHRIAMWATAGLLVAGGWGLYFARASKDIPKAPIVYALARVTQPVFAIVGWYFPLSLYLVLAANAATYALVGLIVEMLRRQLSHSK